MNSGSVRWWAANRRRMEVLKNAALAGDLVAFTKASAPKLLKWQRDQIIEDGTAAEWLQGFKERNRL